MKKKVLVIGSRGLVGNQIVKSLETEKKYEIIAINRHYDNSNNVNRSYATDISLNNSLTKIIKIEEPSFIIFAAGLTDVDKCEQSPFLSYLTNVRPIVELSNITNLFDTLVYLSTDSVFDGNKKLYSEFDSPNPQNVYSKHKRQSEIIISNKITNHIIYRFNVVGYDSNYSKGLLNWILKNAESKNKINGISDVIFNPLHSKQISNFIVSNLGKTSNKMVHLALENSFSKSDFIQDVLEIGGFEKKLVKTKQIADFDFIAARPKNTSLSSNYIDYFKYYVFKDLIKNDIESWQSNET